MVRDRKEFRTIRFRAYPVFISRFTCPGDGKPVHKDHHGWIHWLDKPLTSGGRVTFDLWPSTSELEEDELFPIPGLSLPPLPNDPNARPGPAKVFSSRHPRTVRRHFRWMREHEISGVFLQRFLSETMDNDIRKLR